MTDNEIIKALECCISSGDCKGCPSYIEKDDDCLGIKWLSILDLINRQQAENDRLESVLIGVMHFVDKWLNGAELEQDEINRAIAMREKTLQIVEKLEEENDFLKSIDTDKIKAEAIKDFAERLKEELISYCKTVVEGNDMQGITETGFEKEDVMTTIDNLVKEMVGEE